MTSDNSVFATIPEILEIVRQKKMFIMVDDENRENEGDFVIPASFATAENVNFMAKYGRGLICLALTTSRVTELGLTITKHNNSARDTAFTNSIEAKTGVTTGISAADRARTIEVAISEDSTAKDLVSPGHVFPLAAVNGGVLLRAGHTEGAVDIAKLAGLNQSAVICEIMNDDGTMSRLGDLEIFARNHDMKIISIADLIEYRKRSEKLVKKVSSQEVIFEDGIYQQIIYMDMITNSEHIVYTHNIQNIQNIQNNQQSIPLRIHNIDYKNDLLRWENINRSNYLTLARKYITNKGFGCIIILNNERNNQNKVIKNYGIGAQILLDLNIRNIDLITNSRNHLVGLDGYGILINNYIDLT